MKIENTLMTKQKCIQFSQQELPLNVFRMEDLIEKEDLLKFRKGETTVVQTVEKMREIVVVFTAHSITWRDRMNQFSCLPSKDQCRFLFL